MSNAKGMRPAAVEQNSNYALQLAYTASNEVEYLGKADIGTATSAATWQIKKFTWTSGNLTKKEWADGNEAFDNVWDNRASLDYS
jgi:hypothetical protein